MSFTIVLTSLGGIKKSAIQQQMPDVNIFCFSTALAPLPEQPINSGAKCAQIRTQFALDNLPADVKYDLIVSIENEITSMKTDIAHINIYTKDGETFTAESDGIPVPTKFFDLALQHADDSYPLKELGGPVTVGYLLEDHYGYDTIDSKNWMSKSSLWGGKNYDRLDQIGKPLNLALDKWKKSLFSKSVIKVPDFPKPGVIFQDLSNILASPKLLSILINDMANFFPGNNLNVKVMGLDARGFIYGSLLAYKLKCGFIMARKKGKLPGQTTEKSYGTEYSQSTIEIMSHLIKPGDKIIICDDLVATGGSLRAAADIVEMCQGEVIACITVLSVPEMLKTARIKLDPIPIHVLYD